MLGETVSFNEGARISLERDDFVGARPSSQRPRWNGGPRPDSMSNPLWMPIGAGVAGGGLGLVVGAGIGVAVGEASNCESWGCLAYPLLGAAVGEVVGLSSGVALGAKRSNYLATLLGGGLATLGGLGLVQATDSPEALALVPVVQLGVTIPIARATR